MCTRVTMKTDGAEIARLFDVQSATALTPSYNIAPTDPIPIIRKEPAGRILESVRWGLIPSWAKDPSIGTRLVNARAETVGEKRSFSESFAHRRCLVVADGFYEWKGHGKRGPKQPYYFKRRDGRAFVFAGLWAEWQAPDGVAITSCSVITRAALGGVRELHNRMPAVLDDAHLEAWLDPGADDVFLAQLLSRGEGPGGSLFEHFPVSSYVSNVHNDGPKCVEPITLKKQGDLFG